MELLLRKYISFKISISSASVKQIFLETFHELKKETEDKNGKQESSTMDISETTESNFKTNTYSGNYSEKNKNGSKNNKLSSNKIKLEVLKEKLIDKLRGKGFTDPLILDSMMSLGFYSCFRVICTKKKPRRFQKKSELEKRIPLTLEFARNIHSKALRQFSNLIPQGHTVPLPIHNSEYWVSSDYQPHPLKQNLLQDRIFSAEENNKQSYIGNNYIEESTFTEDESEFSHPLSDLLTIIAFTNSETVQNGVDVNGVLETDSLLGVESDD